MVIVVTGRTTFDTSPLATALAERLGWPLVDAHGPSDQGRLQAPAFDDRSHAESFADSLARGSDGSASFRSLRERAVHALDRREPLILAAPPLSQRDYANLREGLRTLRVVSLRRAEPSSSGPPAPFEGASPSAATPEQHVVGASVSEDLTLDPAAEVDTLVGHVRLAFGI